MLRYMLDTNICIYVIKQRPTPLREQFNRFAEHICISAITLAELYYGLEKSSRRVQNLQAVEELVARLDVLPFSAEAAVHYGQLRAELERAGQPAGSHDILIGAHARSAGLTVVTNNLGEFERMPGLRTENWVGSATS
jgi:tRNA(fMet)-specific endonuclease VapC